MKAKEALEEAKKLYKDIAGESTIGDSGTEAQRVQAITLIAAFLMEYPD
jgi:hypothetical protein